MFLALLRVTAVAVAWIALPLYAASWRELSPEDLAADRPRVDPDASVEVLYKEIEFDNSGITTGAVQHLHVRLKVFDARGVDRLRMIPLTYPDAYHLFGVAARVVRPDGTATELPREAFFDTELVRDRNVRLRRKAFAPPHLAPGDIVEFKASVSFDRVTGSVFIQFQEPWPIRHARIRYVPFELPGVSLRTIWWKAERTEQGVSHGTHVYDVRNVPARLDEPFQPSDSLIAPWVLILQLPPGSPPPERFWSELGRQLHKDSAGQLKPRPGLVTAAREIAGAAVAPEEKLARLYEFCRSEIRNTAYDFEQRITPDQRKKISGTDGPEEILARRYGNPHNVRVLFAALANAAGIEAKLAYVNDRKQFAFSEKLTDRRALPDGAVAVKLGGGWRFFDPGSRYHDFGALRWENEGTAVLVAGNGKVERTPPPAPGFSGERRRGKLALDENGTLAGEIRLEYRGHRGVELKERLDDLAPADREKEIVRRIRELIPTAELTQVELHDVTEPSRPLVVTAVVRAPEFAERAGHRLFLPPAVFARAAKPMFVAPERVTDVQFDYPWTEEDDVRIALPAGYELEQASAPASFDHLPFARYTVSLAVTRGAAPELIYQREFVRAALAVPVRHYAVAKAILDEALRQDQHAVTLRPRSE